MKPIFILLICCFFLITGVLSVYSGQMGKSHFFVFLNTNPNRQTLSASVAAQLQQAHIDNINRLAREGKLIVAGPFDGGGGMFILLADSLKQAEGFVATDPAVQSHRFIIEVLPLHIRHGKICPAPEDDYHMANYSFIRFEPAADVVSHLRTVEMDSIHGRYIDPIAAQGQLLMAASFNRGLNGFLILEMENAEAEKILANHPLIKDAQLSGKLRRLWIAKESFCR